MSHRVLLAGIFHETHNFLEGLTPLGDFTTRRGDELFTARGDGSPLAGVLQVADEAGWSVIPVIDMRATPSATASDESVEVFWTAFRAAVEREAAAGIDGVYLVLHGAMVSKSFEDVEGEILERIRALPPMVNVPICGVMDLHGNISPQNVESMQGMVAYRHNPHTDACQAAVDAARILDRILKSGERPVGLWEQPPVMWPPTGTGTADDPMRTLEAMARDIERQHPDILAVNVFGGFSFSDTKFTGPSFCAYTVGDVAVARRKLQELSAWCLAHKELGNRVDPSLDDVWPQVEANLKRGETPVVLVEPSDNIGGGAPGDGTSILRYLIRKGATNAAVVIDDGAAVATLSKHKPGERVRVTMGGRGSRMGEGPVELDVELVSTSDGRFQLEDRNSHLASMCGVNIDMGPCAVVRHEGVTILLTTRKTPPFDLGQLRSQGIIPEKLAIIGVKAAVAHRRAYEPIQKASYTVSTPGPCASDARIFPFQKVRRPLFPLDALQ